MVTPDLLPPRPDMNEVVGRDDLLLLTLDTLRYDVAVEAAAAGRLPNLAAHLPEGRWQRRHAPGNFTYASHQAIFAGFLPTPAAPGPHPRLFAARFAGSETTAEGTFVFDAPDLVTALAGRGYHTVCIGGVGFFNKQGALGNVLPGLFAESHWEPGFSVASPTSFEEQVARAEQVVAGLPAHQRLFLFLNASALHQPNWFHLPGRPVRRATAGPRMRPHWNISTGTWAACSTRCVRADAVSPSSAPITAPPTGMTATPDTGWATSPCGQFPTATSFWSPPHDRYRHPPTPAVSELRLRLPAQDGLPSADTSTRARGPLGG
ncbi:STM4013/SEN3800 family hydrolase [Nocardia sp. NPDC050710]|uniref:STM4013/SEN3800 family hydrolase n=1 Tax=Nocardia sp. NPDC050710 TaxID=3157220 RepID=UPI0033D8B264